MSSGLAAACLIACLAIGCRRAHQVGDHVLVDWRGSEYAAVIVAVEAPSRFRVHFDGYSEDWDETIPATRVKGRLRTAPNTLPSRGSPFKPSVQPSGAASGGGTPPAPASGPAAMYHVGDRVRVEWHGSIYPATITESVGDDRYRVHYEGYGNEWDETLGSYRIQRKSN